MKHYEVIQQGSKKGKKDKRHFRYISKKQYKALCNIQEEHPEIVAEPAVIGSTKLKAYNDEKARKSNKKQCDYILELNGFKYKGFKKKKGLFLKGYMDMGGGDYTEYRTNYPLILIFLLGLLLMFCLLRSPIIDNIDLPFIPQGQGEQWNGELPTITDDIRGDYIEIQGYTSYTLNKDLPELPLVNNKDNTVLLQYDISENDKTIYSSDWIKPDAAIYWNAYETLGAGSHTLIFNISALDMETGEPCTGATQTVTIDIREG